MSINQLAIPIVARSIGKKFNVKVIYGHEQPSTNGDNIYLPDMPLDDEKTRILGLGFVVHESGHVRYTKFDIDAPQSPLHKHLRNVFEDIRMEKQVIATYPGAKKILCELVEHLVDTQFFKAGEGEQTSAQIVSRYLLYTLRASALEQSALTPLAELSENALEDLVTDGAMTRLHSVMSRVITSKSTQDAHDLALEVIKILEDDIEPPKEDDEEQEDNTESGDDGENTPPDSTPDPTDTDDNSTQQEVQSTDNADKKAIEEMLNATDDDLDEDLFESLVPEQLNDAIEEAISQGCEVCGDGRADTPPLPLGSHADAYAKVYKQTYALRNRLQSFMQAEKRVKRGTSQSGTKLHDKKLYRVKTGNASIYRSKQRKKVVNTAVQVLIDRSYSMETMMTTAMNSTLAITSALESIPGVKVAASAFPGRLADVEPLTMFGETVKGTAARYPSVQASGGTPLLPALIWSTQQLLNCKEERKILLIVTDGEPENIDDCKDMLKQLRKNNIETMGLGINVPSVDKLFKVSVCINNENELASAMFSMLQENLKTNAA